MIGVEERDISMFRYTVQESENLAMFQQRMKPLLRSKYPASTKLLLVYRSQPALEQMKVYRQVIYIFDVWILSICYQMKNPIP